MFKSPFTTLVLALAAAARFPARTLRGLGVGVGDVVADVQQQESVHEG